MIIKLLIWISRLEITIQDAIKFDFPYSKDRSISSIFFCISSACMILLEIMINFFSSSSFSSAVEFHFQFGGCKKCESKVFHSRKIRNANGAGWISTEYIRRRCRRRRTKKKCKIKYAFKFLFFWWRRVAKRNFCAFTCAYFFFKVFLFVGFGRLFLCSLLVTKIQMIAVFSGAKIIFDSFSRAFCSFIARFVFSFRGESDAVRGTWTVKLLAILFFMLKLVDSLLLPFNSAAHISASHDPKKTISKWSNGEAMINKRQEN